MKKFILPAAAAAAVLLTGCSSDTVSTQAYNYKVLNLVTSSSPEEAPSVCSAVYNFDFNLTAGVVTLSTNAVKVGGSDVFFQLKPIPYKSTLATLGDRTGVHTDLQAATPANGGSGAQVTDLECQISDVYTIAPSVVPGVTGIGTVYPPYLKMRYVVDDTYTVRTFLPDNTFAGTTMTQYPSAEGLQSYENGGILYRVVLDVEKKKADVVLYNAKFAQPAPELTMILKDLDLTFTNSGYVITGEEIVPEVVEGSGTTPNPKYPFNRFTLQTDDSFMTSASCQYTVSGVFQGSFSGRMM